MRPSASFGLILAILFYNSSVVISVPTPASSEEGVAEALTKRDSFVNSTESSNPAAKGWCHACGDTCCDLKLDCDCSGSRYFLLEGFRKLSNEPMFGFNVLQYKVVAMKGEAARKAFYDRKDLSFTEGYRLLFGGGPDIKDVVPDVKDKNDQEQSSWVMKRLTPLLRMERIAQLTPLFMSDLERNIIKWGDSGKFDPFEDMYTVVFQLTIRAGGCREIADSVEQCKRMEDLFWAIDEGATPVAVLFPWFPSDARRKKVKATAEVFAWFDQIIKARKQEDRREEDALQMLLDLGYSTTDVIEFVLFTLFAGIINTGLMTAWLFIFLDQEPGWRDK
ncbi:hypothetical protein FRC07_001017, partial [Ceratobasidium sp. 392]